MTTQNPRSFSGFTLPDGAWLPPELIQLLPQISSLAQLKVIIIAISHHMQVGGSEPLTLSDFEMHTGMARQSIVDAIQALISGESAHLNLLERQKMGKSYTYSPRLNLAKESTSPVSRPQEPTVQKLDSNEPDEHPATSLESRLQSPIVQKLDSKRPEIASTSLDSRLQTQNPTVQKLDSKSLRESESIKDFKDLNSTDSLKDLNIESISSVQSGHTDSENHAFLQELRTLGIYLKTAQSLLKRFGEDRIREKIPFYLYALRSNMANGPGWMVTAVKEDWPAPPGYVAPLVIPAPEEFIDPERDAENTPGAQVSAFQTHPSLDKPITPAGLTPREGWQKALESLQFELPKTIFDRWLAALTPARFENQTLVLLAASTETRLWLEERLTAQINRLLVGIFKRADIQIAFQTVP